MKLLAFETATEACSVALWIDGEVRERFEVAPRRHAELALPWAGQLLAEAGIARSQLDAIAVGRGPGAFTGVRLAIAIAQGIALALDRPVVPVSTLAVLAMQGCAPSLSRSEGGDEVRLRATGSCTEERPTALPEGRTGWGGVASDCRILAAIDARMGEVYFAAFARNGGDVVALSQEIVAPPDAVVLPDDNGDWFGIGTGFAAADGILHQALRPHLRGVDATALPHAADVARLAAIAFARGEVLPPERVEPAYLRDKVALTLVQQAELRASR